MANYRKLLTKRQQQKQGKKRIIKMSEEAKVVVATPTDAAIEIAKTNAKNHVTLEISRPDDGQSLAIFIKAPVLAEIVSKMANSNYDRASYAPIFKDILVPLPDDAARVVTKAAVCKITKNFIAAQDWAWDVPRAALIYNPEKLAEGYTLLYKVDQPLPPDLLRNWGKRFMEGCNDIIANARPFKMSWVMQETDKF